MEYRKNVRQKLLRSVLPDIKKKIESLKSVKDLSQLKKSYLYKADLNQLDTKSVGKSINTKLAKLLAFRPTTDGLNLTVNNFNPKGLSIGNDLLAIYLGDFTRVSFDKKAEGSTILMQYMKSFSDQCRSYLPRNNVAITDRECTA